MRNVFVVGVGQTRFGKFLERTIRSLSEEALRLAIEDSGLNYGQIDIVYFANALSGLITGQETIRGQVALRHSPLMGKPIINIDNACSSGSSAFQLAWLSVASGQANVALALGAEKLTHTDKAITFSAYASGVDVEERDETRREKPTDRSLFMDVYAERARKYMARSGATAEDFAKVTVKSRHAASLNPKAQFRQETTVEEVLGSRVVSAPLTLPMCSPIGDGAAAVILATEDIARSLSAEPVRVLASATVSANAGGVEPAAAFRAAQKAYALAGLGPRDVHVAEVHDASASAEIMLYEHLGFADRNRGFELIRDGVTAIGGSLPVNSGGGLLSRGHPVGATGVAQLVELTSQLRGQAGARQRPHASVALAECSGGQIGADSAVATVIILANMNAVPQHSRSREAALMIRENPAADGIDPRKLQELNLRPLWTEAVSAITKEAPGQPLRHTIPTLWRHRVVREQLLRAGKHVTVEQAERRVLVLVNPGHKTPGGISADSAIFVGAQLVLPHEATTCHSTFCSRRTGPGRGFACVYHCQWRTPADGAGLRDPDPAASLARTCP